MRNQLNQFTIVHHKFKNCPQKHQNFHTCKIHDHGTISEKHCNTRGLPQLLAHHEAWLVLEISFSHTSNLYRQDDGLHTCSIATVWSWQNSNYLNNPQSKDFASSQYINSQPLMSHRLIFTVAHLSFVDCLSQFYENMTAKQPRCEFWAIQEYISNLYIPIIHQNILLCLDQYNHQIELLARWTTDPDNISAPLVWSICIIADVYTFAKPGYFPYQLKKGQ